MTRLDKEDLFTRATQAIKESGWNILYLSPFQEHPLRFQMYQGQESITIRLYIWNLTHGGGARRPTDEYRIQVTGITRFEPEAQGKTIILGWWEDAGVFAAFDYSKHAGPLGSSPSFQISRKALEQALVNGLALHPKGNDEIAIAIRPDFLAEYIKNLKPLHEFGEYQQATEILETISEDPFALNEEVIEGLPEPRRIAIQAVKIRIRATSFQRRVLSSYDYTCAMCGLQLELIEAAHIIPITHSESRDEVYNGLALCVLHHNAYDKTLLTIDESYHLLINETELERLEHLGRNGGQEMFIDNLRSPIKLPTQIAERPNQGFVKRANEIRGWQYLEPGQIRVI